MPPSAASNRPARSRSAPVKAPFTQPNSSLSSSVSGKAAQLMATKGCAARGLPRWMARAISSLPVPVSPEISTLARVRLAHATSSNTCCITGLSPTMPSGEAARAGAASGAAASRAGPRASFSTATRSSAAARSAPGTRGSTSAAPAARSSACACSSRSASRTSSGGSRRATRRPRSAASASPAFAASITSASKLPGSSASAFSRLRSHTKSSVGASPARSTGISSPRLSQRIVRIGCMQVSSSPSVGRGAEQAACRPRARGRPRAQRIGAASAATAWPNWPAIGGSNQAERDGDHSRQRDPGVQDTPSHVLRRRCDKNGTRSSAGPTTRMFPAPKPT